MFNLEEIENDWENSLLRLTDEEIMEIYQSEGITLENYLEEEKRYNTCYFDTTYTSVGLEYFKYVYNGNEVLIEKIFEDFNSFYSKIKPIDYKNAELRMLSNLSLILPQDRETEFQKILNELNISYVLKSISDKYVLNHDDDFYGIEDDFFFDDELPFGDYKIVVDEQEDNFKPVKHEDLTEEEIIEYGKRKIEYEKWYLENYNKEFRPVKKHLSLEKQKIVVAGCMDYVFDYTKYYYKYLNGQVDIEKIYYVCLEALINAAKYCIHCEKPVFRSYVIKCIERNMIYNIAKWNGVGYRDIYPLVDNMKSIDIKMEDMEESTKPSSIFYQMRNISIDVNYNENMDNDDFMQTYFNVLNQLDELERQVMLFSYDKYGYKGLTYKEISDYLGISEKNVKNIKCRCLRFLRKNEELKSYLK